MAQISAFEAFDMNTALNFSVLGDISDDFAFLDNINQSVFGTVLQDIAAYQFQDNGPHLAVFGGRNFSFINDVPVSGTVTAMALTNGSLADGIGGQDIAAFITGLSVSAVDLAKAVASPSLVDDARLVAAMFARADRFDLSEGDDLAFGFGGNDKMFGNGGDDLLAGGDGNDSLFGGAGNDRFNGGSGADVINGGTGSDTAVYTDAADAVTINLGLTVAQANGDRLISIESLIGSDFDDVFIAGRAAGVLEGRDGDDTLTGGVKADVLSGGNGVDLLTGGAGNDFFFFDATPNTADNADIITDFVRGRDKLVLSSAEFKNLPVVNGHLDPAAFLRSATATAARDADDRLIYNTKTGLLFYDVDGVGGKAAVEIALLGLAVHPALAATDILVV